MRKLAFAALAAVVAAQAVAASAQAPAPSSARSSARSGDRDRCFAASMVNGFQAPNDHTVYVRVGVNEVWRLDLFAPCLDVDWNLRIAIQSRTGSSFVCDGFDADLIVPSHGMGPQRCQIEHIHKLTPAEIAALPRKDRP